jgi:hypothetical protein
LSFSCIEYADQNQGPGRGLNLPPRQVPLWLVNKKRKGKEFLVIILLCAWDFNTVSNNVLSISSSLFAGTVRQCLTALNSVSNQTVTWNFFDVENSEACLQEYRGASCSKYPVRLLLEMLWWRHELVV